MTVDDSAFFQELEADHLTWLNQFNPQYALNWIKLRDLNREAAFCEVSGRQILQAHGVDVAPNESLEGKKAPDFLCAVGEHNFYVEVTCLGKDSLDKRTHLVDSATKSEGGFNPDGFTESLFNACKVKANQCASQTDYPTLLVVGTFHGWVSCVIIRKTFISMALTGNTGISWKVFPQDNTGAFVTTELERASFFWWGEDCKVTPKRCSISGVLVLGLGIQLPAVLGYLHPYPERAFDHAKLLPSISFGSVKVQGDRLVVRWSDLTPNID